MTHGYEEWRAQEVRRPGDIPSATPLAWLAERHSAHGQRLADRQLPEDFPGPVVRGDAGDALAQLALGTQLARSAAAGQPGAVLEALQLGATWRQIATALDTSPDRARALLRDHADAQLRLHEGDHDAGAGLLGWDPAQRDTVRALTLLGDDESADAVGASVPGAT
ncbi:hypothetical protein [Streptomyces sp. x-19]|uniref:hypothetical protein n=1 Tax=Streptomyces sp. x-19 TaxID=2789280 RepID=UPI00398050F9